MDPHAAKKQLSAKMNSLSPKSFAEDYEAIQAVLSSISIFLAPTVHRLVVCPRVRNPYKKLH